jgi:hypothetical protein
MPTAQDHPKQRVYPAAWLCIYCSDGRIKQATKHKLSGEHIIPFGLGGTAILPRASCKACARITGAIEQLCLRTMLGATRIRLNLPTRRPEERPTELQIILVEGNKTTERTIPASEFPLAIPGLLLPPPGLLSGEKPHDRMVGKFWMTRENETADKYLKPGGGYRAGTFNNHVFMQMLARSRTHSRSPNGAFTASGRCCAISSSAPPRPPLIGSAATAIRSLPTREDFIGSN